MSVLLRKALPGSDSFGHEWKTSRSVVEVTDEQAGQLLAIADAGFEVVNRPADDEDQGESAPVEVTEVDPDADDATAAAEPTETGDQAAEGDQGDDAPRKRPARRRATGE